MFEIYTVKKDGTEVVIYTKVDISSLMTFVRNACNWVVREFGEELPVRTRKVEN